MSRFILCLGTLSLLCLAEPLAAIELCPDSLGRELRCTRCAVVPCCCPNDYCRKPLPCIPCPALPTTADCYCRKPLPCVPRTCMSWCCDDYCRKPLPKFCWPVNQQFYRCPPCDDGATASPCPTAKIRRCDEQSK